MICSSESSFPSFLPYTNKNKIVGKTKKKYIDCIPKKEAESNITSTV